MAGVHTRALTAPRPIKPTSPRCHSAWQPNPGRGSTYRCGKSVQTTGITSGFDRGLSSMRDLLILPHVGCAALLDRRCDRDPGGSAVRTDVVDTWRQVTGLQRDFATGYGHCGCPDHRVWICGGKTAAVVLR